MSQPQQLTSHMVHEAQILYGDQDAPRVWLKNGEYSARVRDRSPEYIQGHTREFVGGVDLYISWDRS